MSSLNLNAIVKSFSRKRKAEQSDSSPKRWSPDKTTPQTVTRLTNKRKLLKANTRNSNAATIKSSPTSLSMDDNSSPGTKDQKTLCEAIPIDLSIKDRIKICSKDSFAWASAIPSLELSIGTSAFVKNSSIQEADSCDYKSQLKQCLLSWVHPSIPLQSNVMAGSINQDMLDTIKQDWQIAFTSAYQQMMNMQSPYFYLLTSDRQLSMLFTSGDASDSSSLPNAFLSGNTQVWKKYLTKEGIAFKEYNENDSNTIYNILNDPDIGDLDDWLKGVGINPDSIKIENKRQSKCSTTSSVISIPYRSLQALYNFLLNCPYLTEKVGSYAEIPPTLLSPNAFEGATLKSARIQTTSAEHGETFHTMNITGVMLPTNLLRLHQLMAKSQNGNYELTCSSNKITEGFCKVTDGTIGGSVLHGSIALEISVRCLGEVLCENSQYYL